MSKPHKTHSKGAWCEYLAAHHFLEQGYQVFWPSIQQGSVDFIVERGRRLDRMQVKKASWQGTPQNGNKYLQVVTTNNDKEYTDQYDFLVVVDDVKRIWIIPATQVNVKCLVLDDMYGNKRRPTDRYLVSQEWTYGKESLDEYRG